MNAHPRSRRGRTAGLAATGLLAAGLAGTAAPAQAAYTHAVAGDTLTITGDDASDTLSLSVDESGRFLRADVGTDGTIDFTVDRETFSQVVVDLGGGDDTFAIDDANGHVTERVRTTVRGGAGQDFITGGFGGELLAGGDGDDLILGHGGDDALLGEGGDDALQADEGEDEVLGGDGDDRTYVWEPDGDDRIDGGAGDDLTQIRGTYRDDRFEVRAAALPGHVRVERDGGAQKPDLAGVERLEILTSTGSDIVLGDQHLAGLIALSADLGAGNDYAAGGDEADHFDGGPDDDDLRGGAGDDTLTAGPGGDEMEGGDGDDTLAGGTGVDELSGDAGNDRFTWTTGDEAGLADGGEGVDTFAVTGSDDKDGFTLRNEAAPGTSSLTRHGASERSTLRDVETVEAATAGGDDLMVATSTRTGVRLDGGPGADQFRFGGTEAADQYTALRTRAPGHVRVINDKLPVNHDLVATELFDVVAFGGDDTATIGPGLGGQFALRIDAGAGADSVQGGEADDVIDGGAGDDTLRGGPGGDTIQGADGTDTLAGEAGADTLDGGTGIDTFSCGGRGDTLVSEPQDVIGADC